MDEWACRALLNRLLPVDMGLTMVHYLCVCCVEGLGTIGGGGGGTNSQ